MGTFSRFLEVAAFSQGSMLNVSDAARETGVNRKTVSGYFRIVEDLLLAFRLPVFTRRARRRLVSHSKFYFFDAGLFYGGERERQQDGVQVLPIKQALQRLPELMGACPGGRRGLRVFPETRGS